MASRTQLINKRNRLTVELHDVRETIADIEKRGVASVNISTGDGQKSATNLALKDLYDREAFLKGELATVRRQLRGGPAFRMRHLETRRS